MLPPTVTDADDVCVDVDMKMVRSIKLLVTVKTNKQSINQTNAEAHQNASPRAARPASHAAMPGLAATFSTSATTAGDAAMTAAIRSFRSPEQFVTNA
jgi:hypothetical protein